VKVVAPEEAKLAVQVFVYAPEHQEASTKAWVSRLLEQATYHLQHDAFEHREASHQNDFDLQMKVLACTVQEPRFLVPLGPAMSVLFCPCTFISKP
jgi:hypothetical protein